jgi:hypothetical protein
MCGIREDRSECFLVSIGDAWFDDTERIIRIGVNIEEGKTPSFNVNEFAQMTPENAQEYERGVLNRCYPEAALHRDCTPDHGRWSGSQRSSWMPLPRNRRD